MERLSQADSLYNFFLIFTKNLQSRYEISLLSPKVIKQKTFWDETEENTQNHERNEKKKSCTVIFVGLGSKNAIK